MPSLHLDISACQAFSCTVVQVVEGEIEHIPTGEWAGLSQQRPSGLVLLNSVLHMVFCHPPCLYTGIMRSKICDPRLVSMTQALSRLQSHFEKAEGQGRCRKLTLMRHLRGRTETANSATFKENNLI